MKKEAGRLSGKPAQLSAFCETTGHSGGGWHNKVPPLRCESGFFERERSGFDDGLFQRHRFSDGDVFGSVVLKAQIVEFIETAP